MGKTAAGPLLTTIAAVTAWLDEAVSIDPDVGTKENPIPLRLGEELYAEDTDLNSAINSKAKYVALDLSAMTNVELFTIHDFSTFTGFRTYAVTIVFPDVSWKIESIPAGSPVFTSGLGGFEVLKEVRGANITTIGDNAFAGCSNLESVSFPKAGSNGGTIGNAAFAGCTSLTTVNLPKATTINPNAFSYCTALTTLILPAAPPALPGSVANGAFINTNTGAGLGTTLTIKVPPSALNSYTTTWNVAADTLPGADPTVYGNNHKRIFITDSGASPPFLLTSVTAVTAWLDEAALNGPASGTPADPIPLPVGLQLSNTNWTDLLDAIAFVNRYVNLDLSACIRGPDSTPGSLYEDGTFDPDYSNNSIGKGKIVSLVLPDAAESIKASTNPSYATFEHFGALKNVSGANILTMGAYAFRTILIATVDFPEATTIGQYAFQACTALTTVNLPKAMDIGENAFEGFGTGPLTVTLGSAPPELGTAMFSLVPSTKNVTVRVPSGATAWNTIVSGSPYNEPGPTYNENWGNGFRGGGWDGSAFQYGGASYVNSNVKLTIEEYTP
jgi:hypothetical protein